MRRAQRGKEINRRCQQRPTSGTSRRQPT